MLTRDQVIKKCCQIVALVYSSIGDYSHASDGFCTDCVQKMGSSWSYRHGGQTLEFVRLAVIEKMARDGITPNPTAIKETMPS